MELAGNTVIESPDERAPNNVTGSTGDINSVIDSIKASVINNIRLTKDQEPSKVLRSQQTCTQDDLDTSLLSACYNGYAFLVYELVRSGADVQARDKNGNTPLMICVEKGFLNTVMFFLRGQVDINAANYCGDTALILASGGSVEVVKLLLAHSGIDVNHQNKKGYTALMRAVVARNVDVIKLLLESQKNAAEAVHKLRNCRNETAQNIADRLGLGKVVELLLQPGEPIMGAVRACDVDSFNVLLSCKCYDSSVKSVIANHAFQRIFINHQKFVKEFSPNEEYFIQVLLDLGAIVYDRYFGLDPVFIATRAGSCKVLQLLLERVTKSDLYARRRHMDPLKVAAENGRMDLVQLLCKYSPVSHLHYSHLECAIKNGHPDCARFLVKQGVIIDIKTAITSAVDSQLPERIQFLIENFQVKMKQFALTKDMDNLLLSSCKNGDLEIIGQLLDAGANVNCVSDVGKTPLLESKNAQVVYYLVKRGAFVKQNSTALLDCYSPVLYILSKDSEYHELSTREAILEALLECGADVDVKDSVGRTPLMIAVTNRESKNIVQMLLRFDAQCSVRDIQGRTPLLLAIEADKEENVLCVLQFCGHNMEILNAQKCTGHTPLIVATNNNNLVVVEHLLSLGANVSITDVTGNTALLHAVVSDFDDNRNIISALVSAGSDINHQNNAGLSPLMLAAKDCKIQIMKWLVHLGADVNCVSKRVRITALTVLSYQQTLDQHTLNCMTYLLDQGARASYVSQNILHKLILQKRAHFIPKLIHSGLGPSLVAFSNPDNPGVISMMSPLCVSILTKNLDLSKYFIGNLFMTKSDTCTLLYNQTIRKHLRFTPFDALFTEVAAKPLSLFTLAFVAVQAAVGSTSGREERISTLPLPRLIKDKLLFKKEDVALDAISACK